VRSRLLTAAVGLLASVVVSVVAYVYLDTLLLFLVVPFVPFLFRGLEKGGAAEEEPAGRECPACGYRTRAPDHDYCPRDGTRLEVSGDVDRERERSRGRNRDRDREYDRERDRDRLD
jgi:hypothetical protein